VSLRGGMAGQVGVVYGVSEVTPLGITDLALAFKNEHLLELGLALGGHHMLCSIR
jgi:hypothetical protein